jgi:AAA+ superfamily predicted ATPase
MIADRSCVRTGTGKTCLIKALACHTKRNIVNIPLARIRTNQARFQHNST